MPQRRSLFDADLNPLRTVTDWKFGRGNHIRGDKIVVRGRVEYNRDPDHRGRVMVRVIEDGPEMRISNKQLPRVATFDLGWCEPLFSLAGGMGFGSFSVPQVGARVYVLYERGEETNPVYFGGWFANSPRKRRYGATRSTLTPPVVEFEDDSGYDEEGNATTGGKYQYPPKPPPYHGAWDEEQGPELPLELSEMIDHTPDTQLLFKTLKGASFIVKERDEAEEFTLTDRLGAGIKISSHTLLSEEGVVRRGRVSATEHEAMTLDNLAFTSHTMSFLTATRTGLEIENTADGKDDSLHLQIHPEHPYSKNPELMDTRVAVELDEGERRVRLIYKEDGVVTGQLEFDAIAKTINLEGLEHIHLNCDTDIVLTAPKVKIHGDLDVEGEIRHLGGEKFVFIDNNMEPYGSQFRNHWTHKLPNIPQPQHDPIAEIQLNERRWW